jgi:hypothetical protein
MDAWGQAINIQRLLGAKNILKKMGRGVVAAAQRSMQKPSSNLRDW